MNNIAIIPARGGSKRVPLKNIRSFLGRPMLTRTIETLQSSGIFDRIIVSTDSEEIFEIALRSPGVEISSRNAKLSQDKTNIIDVIASEINVNGISGDDNVCCVYAPNPFLHQSALKLGLMCLLENSEADYVTPVTTFPFPIQRSLKFQGERLLTMAESENLLVHSQNLEPRFHETAQFWWAKAKTWEQFKPMQQNLLGIYTPRWMSQDIDSLEDWEQAEIRWQILKERGIFDTYEFDSSSIVTSNFAP
jgi:N-acylneuraminate cytidylyltransferase